MILDLTALKDYKDVRNLQKFAMSLDVEKIIVAAETKVEKDAAREHEALHNGETSIRAYLAKVVK